MFGQWGSIQIPIGKTYAKRAEECLWLASVCPEEYRDDYLKLAVEYELLASLEKRS